MPAVSDSTSLSLSLTQSYPAYGKILFQDPNKLYCLGDQFSLHKALPA